MQSMTGFGSATVQYTASGNRRITFTINIKTVNARFFEFNLRAPSQLANAEIAIAKVMRARLIRGTAQCAIQVSDPNALKGTITISPALVAQYVAALTDVQKETNLPGTITINDIMRIPSIFTTQELEADEGVTQALVDGVEQALEKVVEMRAHEGRAMQQDMQSRLTTVTNALEQVTKIFTEIFTERKRETESKTAQLQARKHEGLSHDMIETQRHQLITQLERIDISEEITRLQTHLQSMQALIASDAQEVGKRLEFLLQEGGREVNTLMAKSSDANLAQHGITMKVELEKMREQVQNII